MMDFEFDDDFLEIFSELSDEPVTSGSNSHASSSGSEDGDECSQERSFGLEKRKSTMDSTFPLLLSDSFMALQEEGGNSCKRFKSETRLMKNRESANKSRIKKKIEKSTMEQTVLEYKQVIQQLEQENSALMADNSSLMSQNAHLRSLLNEKEKNITNNDKNHTPVTGVAAFCIVFFFSFFQESFSTLSSFGFGKIHTRSSVSTGRVLLSLEDHANTAIANDPYVSPFFMVFSIICALVAVGGVCAYYHLKKSAASKDVERQRFSSSSVLPS